MNEEYWRERFHHNRRHEQQLANEKARAQIVNRLNDLEPWNEHQVDYLKRKDINNGPGYWTPNGKPPMLITDMETAHIINVVAMIWRSTTYHSRALLPRPEEQRWPVPKLRLENPRAKIREFLKELRKRDRNPQMIRVR